MNKFKTINELIEAQKEISSRRKNCNKVRIMVHMGTCCIAAGSSEIIKTMKSELDVLSLNEEVTVEPSGCIGLCYAEPTVSVLHPNGTYEVYGNIDVQQGRIILNRCRTQSPISGVKQLKPKWEVIKVLEGE